MQLMPCRLDGLTLAVEGLRVSGVPLVGLTADGRFVAPGLTDDVGQYYAIPKLAVALGLPLGTAIDLFWWGLLALAVTSAAVAFARPGGSRPVRGFTFLALTVLTVLALRKLGDVYLAPFCTVLAIVPWWARLPERSRHPILALTTGLAVPLANTLRIHAGTTVLLFAVAILACRPLGRRTRIIMALGLVAGLAAGSLAVSATLARRDAFLTLHGSAPGPSAANRHVVWHNIYIGLGYVPNTHGIVYLDQCGKDRAALVAPHVPFPSPGYDAVLRGEVLRLVREDPTLILYNLAAKGLSLMWTFLRCANLGVIPLLLWRGGWRHQVPWLAALGFAALPGLLTMPHRFYVSGFLALSTLYTLDGLQVMPELLDPDYLRRGLQRVGLMRSSTGS